MQTNTLLIDNVLSRVSLQLSDSPPVSLDDPRLDALLNSKAIKLQLGVAEKLSEFEAKNPEDISITLKLLRALALLERTRSRASRLVPKPAPLEPTVQREDAIRFLKGELSSGPRPATEMFTAARKLGIAQRTLIRAKNDLNIISIQIQPDGGSRCWMWSYSPLTQSP